MTAPVELGHRRFTFARGVHPLGKKALAEDAAVEVLPTPSEVRIPLLQHLGAPCVLSVKPRDEVAIGDLLGDSEAFISAPIHSSIAGKVARLSVATLPNGRHVDVVPIKAAKEPPIEGASLYADILGGPWPTDGLDHYEPRQIADAARRAGLVGLGGAAFPTHVKLRPNDPDDVAPRTNEARSRDSTEPQPVSARKKSSEAAPQTDRGSSQNLTQLQQVSPVKKSRPIDTLLVNGCECEPYLTADARVMIESPQAVVAGALLAGRAVGAPRVVIGIEDNKPRAIEALRAASAGTPAVTQVLKTKYPQGSEKQLIDAVLRRKVPLGGLPLDVGVVVINVGTAAALARAVLRGKPLTHRVVTVSGEGIRTPKNLLVPVGVAYRQLIDYCGGLTSDADRVIAGGPMMGFTLGDLDTPVTKGTSGITVLSHAEVRRSAETACIRCGRCVDVCPMRLVPTRIALGARTGHAAVVARYHATACVECGCCAFECPASIPLVQLIRVGKLMLRPPATKT